MTVFDVFKWIDIICFSAAGIMGIVLLFRNVATAWKWVALAGIVWSLGSLLQFYLPGVWQITLFDMRFLPMLHRILMGFCLFAGMLSVK